MKHSKRINSLYYRAVTGDCFIIICLFQNNFLRGRFLLVLDVDYFCLERVVGKIINFIRHWLPYIYIYIVLDLIIFRGKNGNKKK